MSDSITLITKENEKMKVNNGIARMSDLIKGIGEDSSNEEIPIEQIKKSTLDLIIAYAEHHNYRNPEPIPSPLQTNDISTCIDDWTTRFINNLRPEEFSELLAAANYLQMKSLLGVLLAFTASKVKDKPIDELRQVFSIQDDLTEEAEEKLLEEFSSLICLKFLTSK